MSGDPWSDLYSLLNIEALHGFTVGKSSERAVIHRPAGQAYEQMKRWPESGSRYEKMGEQKGGWTAN